MAIRIDAIPQIRPAIQPAMSEAETAAAGIKEFAQVLKGAMAQVEEAQTDAANATRRLATGEIKDVAEVMIASEKANLALQMTIQVRNKVLEAYQEMMRLPV